MLSPCLLSLMNLFVQADPPTALLARFMRCIWMSRNASKASISCFESVVRFARVVPFRFRQSVLPFSSFCSSNFRDILCLVAYSVLLGLNLQDIMYHTKVCRQLTISILNSPSDIRTENLDPVISLPVNGSSIEFSLPCKCILRSDMDEKNLLVSSGF